MTAPTRARMSNPNYADPDRPRDRFIDSKTVVCPSCGASVGEKCAIKGTHTTRRRLAIQRLHESGSLHAPSPNPCPTGHQVRKARLASGLTLQTLGEMVGTSGGHLSQIERERFRPTGDVASHLADWFAKVTRRSA